MADVGEAFLAVLPGGAPDRVREFGQDLGGDGNARLVVGDVDEEDRVAVVVAAGLDVGRAVAEARHGLADGRLDGGADGGIDGFLFHRGSLTRPVNCGKATPFRSSRRGWPPADQLVAAPK